MKECLGEATPENKKKVQPGYSVWVENGKYFTAPTVDCDKFDYHRYEHGYIGLFGLGTCVCGCRMDRYSSSGPVNPFGPCPSNPKTK